MSDPIGILNETLADRYSIERELGEGGMATVYLASDLRHERRVAIKVLRPELAAAVGAERFLAEIKTTANLQHPHILPLFDSGEADGFLYYVMPYIEGETLRDRLDRENQLGLDEAIRIARDVADALDYAHRHDVIHRDIKPANILLHDGRPVVADFGIALALSGSARGRLTDTGLSPGTPHYMSPEQAAGDRDLDSRTDTYSLGAVCYEMLVGEPPHTAPSVPALLNRILSERPGRIGEVRELVPRNVEDAVRRALAKSPADRFRTVAEFGDALTDPSFRIEVPEDADATTVAGRRPRGHWPAWATAGVLTVVAAWGWLRPQPDTASSAFAIRMPPAQEPSELPTLSFDLSPDGEFLVYVGPGPEGQQLWVKPRDSYEARALEGTDGAVVPTVSPDGLWIAYVVGRRLFRVRVSGGPPERVSESISGPPAWVGASLVFPTVESNVDAVRPGEPARRVWTRNALDFADRVTPLADGEGFLVTTCSNGSCADGSAIWLVEEGDPAQSTVILRDALAAWETANGELIHIDPEGTVFISEVDPVTRALSGRSTAVLSGVRVQGSRPDFSVSLSGDATWISGPSSTGGDRVDELIWVDRQGQIQPAAPDWRFRTDGAVGLAISPDGGRVAIGAVVDGERDIFIVDLNDGSERRLAAPGSDMRPRWTSDGEEVYYLSNTPGTMSVFVRPTDALGDPRLLLHLPDVEIGEAVLIDDRRLLVRTGQVDSRQIQTADIGYPASLAPLLSSTAHQKAMDLSSDGRWVAFEVSEGGRNEVYVGRVADRTHAPVRISSNGGTGPVWSSGGNELFYVDSANRMMAAAVSRTTGVREGDEVVLFDFPSDARLGANYAKVDVDIDDSRFLMIRMRRIDDPVATEADGLWIYSANWLETARKRLKGG